MSPTSLLTEHPEELTFTIVSIPSKHPWALGIHELKSVVGIYMEKPFVHIQRFAESQQQ